MTNFVATASEIALFSTPLSRWLIGARRVQLVGGRHGLDRAQPAATSNGRLGTNRIWDALIEADARRQRQILLTAESD